MQRLTQIPALILATLLCGCSEQPKPDPVAPLVRANAELHQTVDSQARIISTMGGALIVAGGSLAISLGLLIRKGGRPSPTTTQKTADD